jgi:hypothetical protein
MRRAAPLAVAAILLGGIVVLGFLPWLRADRPAVFSTPIARPPSVVAELPLRAEAEACVDNILFAPDAQELKIQATRTPGTGGPPLLVTARADGYRSRTSVPGGYGAADLEIPLRPAPRELGGGTLCVRNTGERSVSFLATVEGRALATARTTVDGRPAPAQLSLTLQERRPASLHARAGELLQRAAAFRPAYLSPAVLWLMVAGVALIVPVATLVALGRALDEDARR